MSEVKCPKCNSTQLSANKKGFSGKKAVAGAVLTGGVGLLAGTIGQNDVIITCLSCGHQWEPKAQAKEVQQQQQAKIIADHKEWQRSFFDAHEAGDIEKAQSLFEQKYPSLATKMTVAECYSMEKKNNRDMLILQVVGGAILILLVWLVAKLMS